MQFHKDGAAPSSVATIYVFGSNLLGLHEKESAKIAADQYGARNGKCYGWIGSSFGIPVRDEGMKLLRLQDIYGFISQFVRFARYSPEKRFFITRVGCGVGESQNPKIAGLFAAAANEIGFDLANCSFAEEWEKYLVLNPAATVRDVDEVDFHM